MSGQVVRKFRWFWDDADHAIERWLQEMAREGLHLKSVGCVRTVFTFERGAPADITYRIDFQMHRIDPSYVQLFEDAGWERVDQLLGWQYWRAPTRDGLAPEIFTDVESQIRKYQRLLWLFALAWMPMAVMLLIKGTKAFGEERATVLYFAGIAAVTLYAVARLLIRIRKLRQRAS
jgi:hypothetical protein